MIGVEICLPTVLLHFDCHRRREICTSIGHPMYGGHAGSQKLRERLTKLQDRQRGHYGKSSGMPWIAGYVMPAAKW